MLTWVFASVYVTGHIIMTDGSYRGMFAIVGNRGGVNRSPCSTDLGIKPKED
jgi:hypothetical protein